ncbi:DUF1553 domain-containing protein [Rhabdobacter roseus]|uniref:LamG-like jellyroll fold domain-containing protein n=1 Tax=Rhabdobacter roseus TaxID=1655419 RepID=A0A840TDX9_9BACT|nr:DUF1553 domain-containing protein [Rhabdobacter roseus]MBB5282326.1 hypothetical protein [Rhabdobacter roseus]
MGLASKYIKSLFLVGTLAGLASCERRVELPEEVALAMKEVPDQVDYSYHVKPILSDRCFACHGPDQNKQKAGLRLDVAEAALDKKCESGRKAIVPGNSKNSEVVYRILSGDPELMMPTPDSHLSLSPQEKATLIRWIEQGAEYKPHWSFTKVEKPQVPAVKNTTWVRNDIDRFILKKLEDQKITPAPEADKTTLLRRVSLDLTGLPPTPAEVDAYLKDTSPSAYEKAVDRLLASPQYGEHMAVPWLDIARYADTHGYQDDGPRSAWPYRDWVIKAYNQNLPYDQFVTWQLAGDLLPKPSRDQLLATAFNRMHQQSQEGGIVPEEYRTEYVADRVGTFGKAFLGLTVECARCHDHKYDPVSQKDFFSLYAFFNNNNENGQIPYNGEASPSITIPTPEAEARLQFIRTSLSTEKRKLTPAQPTYQQRFEQWLRQAEQAPEATIVPAQQDLLGHFTFDEPAGQHFQNLANPEHKARAEGDSLTSSKASRPGRFGKARYIYGENAINFQNDFAFFERNQPFSVSVWLNLHDPAVSGSLIHKSNGVFNGYRGWNVFRLADGRLRFMISHIWPEDAIELQTLDKFPLNQWTHLAFTYDGLSKARGVKLYVNGKPVRVSIHNDNLTQSLLYGKNKSNWGTSNLMIGRLADQYTKNFEVDELKIYTRALTSLEMLGLFTQRNELLLALKTPTARRTPVQRQALLDYYLQHFDEAYKKSQAESLKWIGEETDLLNHQIDVMVMKERKYPRKTFILERGTYDAPGREVSADTPDQLFKIPKEYPRNRLGLARWLLHEDHPLFARVTVNRFWQQYFGQGLARASDDFGNQGDLPTHPELLDWLAYEFRAMKWDVKAFQKMIVLSATYRQSSRTDPTLRELDPENLLYARGPSYRLSAEQIRDNALAASGLLVKEIGGPSVHPYQPAGLWEALATRNSVTYPQQHGDSLYRRSLYTIWKRSSPPPMMLNFDAAERHFCVVKRQKTSTPLQALVTLNDPQFVEASRILAERMLLNGKTPEERITYAYKALTSRPPRPTEIALLKELYSEEYRDFARNTARARQLLQTGEYPADKRLNPVELAATTIVASTIMNFDEFVIKR